MRKPCPIRRLAAILLVAGFWGIPEPSQAQLLLMDGFGPPAFSGFGPMASNRLNMSVSPILSMYNGQTSLLQFQGFGFYPSNSIAVQSGGQIAFVPQQQPVPFGLNMPVRAAATPYGARLDLAPTLQTPGLGPPFPITSFITPVFAGGASGSPVPFTRVIYPPSFSQFGYQTSVGVPNGGQAFAAGNFWQQMGRGEWRNGPFRQVGFFNNGGAIQGFAPRVNVFGP
jgi:hypothetical protein